MALHRRRLSVGLTALAGAAALIAPASASPAHNDAPAQATSHAANSGITLHYSSGVTVKSVKRIGTRQLSVQIVPAGLERQIGVQIILPVGYRQGAARRYPVLYLYPGTSGHSTDWTTVGDAIQTTRPYKLITVSSDMGFNGDGGGWFTNWVNRHTKLGKSQWETYDIHELIPWIDANLNTITARSGRAVAGLSQGGYGATELAAHDPDLFTMMLSFSGAPEIDRDPVVKAGATAIIDATMVGLNGVPQDSPFGDPVTDNINWEGHDPAYYVNNLRGVKLWFSTADGLPGKYDDPVTNPTGTLAAGGIESLTHVSTDTFIGHLRQAHIPFHDNDYGHGTHTWPYWARDLRTSIKVLMKRFHHAAPRPAVIDYKTISQSWSQWSWQVHLKRKARQEFSELSHATVHGFRIEGSGTATIFTPKMLAPASYYKVRIGSAKPKTLITNLFGQLKVVVPLGKSARTVAVHISTHYRRVPPELI
jgi:S-formylglutathione hydrolase FrmB